MSRLSWLASEVEEHFGRYFRAKILLCFLRKVKTRGTTVVAETFPYTGVDFRFPVVMHFQLCPLEQPFFTTSSIVCGVYFPTTSEFIANSVEIWKFIPITSYILCPMQYRSEGQYSWANSCLHRTNPVQTGIFLRVRPLPRLHRPQQRYIYVSFLPNSFPPFGLILTCYSASNLGFFQEI